MDQKQQTPLLCLACLLLLQTCCFSFTTSISSTSTMNRLNYFTDETALLSFKSNVTWDPNHTLSNSWTRNTSFCNWIGVSCSRLTQRVSKLDLHGMNLQGIISPHISNLSFLVYLDLSYNNFHGSLPHELGHLHRLKVIDLDTNKLEGTIPSSLANLSELSYLALSNNNLRGNIQAHLGRLFNLQSLSFFNNSLSDTGCFIPNLNRLDIHSNQMSGKIPITLSDATKITRLWLSKNNLHGSIPDTLGHLLHLEILSLFVNNLTGTIPSNIFNISSLTSLFLSANTLSRHLPENTGGFLPNLEYLDISGNPMSGSIPISLSNASKLIDLRMNENNLNGSIPDTLGHLLHLEVLSMAVNNLRGTIPAEYGLEGKVSIKGDVYSYDILLLEMLTRKKPTDNMFTTDLSLRQWVNAAFPHAIMDVVDMNLQGEISNNGNNSEDVGNSYKRRLSCALSIAEVGLLCSRELPGERISMKDVVIS